MKASNYFRPVVDGRVVEKNNSNSTDTSYIDNIIDTFTTPIYAYQSVPVVINNVTVIKFVQTIRSEIILAAQKLNPSMAISDLGALETWGSNNYGQLGINSTTNSSIPVAVSIGVVNQIAHSPSYEGGAGASCAALDLNGYAWTWGKNTSGQLGNNTTTDNSSPVSVIGGYQFVTITSMSADGFSTLDMSGNAWTWGDNTNGNLGDGTTTSRSSPVSIQTILNFVSIEGSCAIDTNNNCWAWGSNGSGQVGDGTTTPRSVPFLATAGFGFDGKVSSLSNGDSFKLGLTVDGYCYSWGDNTYGNLGDNTTNNRSVPTSVVGGHKFVKISSGSTHSLALDFNGIVWSWGRNNVGQLGNGRLGPTANASSPVSVQSLTKFIDINAETTSSVALDTDGNLIVWGTVDATSTSYSNPFSLYPDYRFKV